MLDNASRGLTFESPPECGASTTEQLFAGLACGRLPLDIAAVRFSVSEYFRNLTAVFVSQYEQEIDRLGSGILPVLQAIPSTDDDIFDLCWDPSFGSLLAAVQHPDRPELPRRISGILLRLAEVGFAMSCDVSLDGEADLRIGKYLLADVVSLSVRSADGAAEVRWKTRLGESGELNFDQGELKFGTSVRKLNEVTGPDPSWLILDPKLVATTEYRGNHTNYDQKPPGQFSRQCNLALSLIERHSPSYLPWVQAVIRCLVPLHSENSGNLLGGSVKTAPGTIHITHSPDAVDIADMLIHETAHQYFHIGAKLGAFTDGSDPTMCFSPFVKADRSIDKILMTYHAFGNAALLYHVLIQDSDLYREKYLPKLRRMLEYIDVVDGYLSRTASLTPFGMSFYAGLHRQIQSERASAGFA